MLCKIGGSVRLLYKIGKSAPHDPGEDVNGNGGQEAAPDAKPAQVVRPGDTDYPSKENNYILILLKCRKIDHNNLS